MYLSPDLIQARLYLARLDARGIFTFQVIPEGKARNAAMSPAILHGSIDELTPRLVELNRMGCGIFVMVNEGDLKGRRAENVVRVRANFLDLDGAPLDPVLATEAPPHLVVESSPGRWHVYWLIDDCPLGEFQTRQQALIDRFSGDPSAKDLCRVLRVPGFYNHKYDPPVISMLRGSHEENRDA